LRPDVYVDSASSTPLADRPIGPALLAAITAASLGRSFRIGLNGSNLEPLSGKRDVFETQTSGSTGTPRVIVRRQQSWLTSFAVNAKLFDIGFGTKVGVLGRLSQSLCLYAAIETLSLGADLYLLDGKRPDRQAESLLQNEIAVLYATPSQMLQIMASAPSPMPGLRYLVIGGGRLDQGLATQLAALFPNALIRQFYGAAETSFITLSDCTTPPNSVGRAYPGVEIIIKTSEGQPVQSGNLGQIWVKSPYLAESYLMPADQGAIWKNGYISVGEWGRLIGQDFYLEGRGQRMVTVADQNVFLDAVEAYLCTCQGVIQAFVLAEPDSKRGHILRAIVQGDATYEVVILQKLRQEYGTLKAPRRLSFRADWPLLPSGKPDVATLRQTP
jgi:long-chain acyl-CoA synthetase